MKSALLVFLIAALYGAGCATDRRSTGPGVPPAPQSSSVRTPQQAVALVKRHIRAHGGDPSREEISAQWNGTQWRVWSWRIVYPNNPGSSRFVPGGYTIYMVDTSGLIAAILPGL
jgi:hypothetical protein